MVARYDKSKSSTRFYDFASGQRVATGEPSAVVDAIEVMLHPTVDVIVTVGETPVAGADDGKALILAAGERFHLQMRQGHKIFGAAVGGAGFLRILPVA